jgi:DNA relaxase NicK
MEVNIVDGNEIFYNNKKTTVPIDALITEEYYWSFVFIYPVHIRQVG